MCRLDLIFLRLLSYLIHCLLVLCRDQDGGGNNGQQEEAGNELNRQLEDDPQSVLSDSNAGSSSRHPTDD